jgi:hypothetical protein
MTLYKWQDIRGFIELVPNEDAAAPQPTDGAVASASSDAAALERADSTAPLAHAPALERAESTAQLARSAATGSAQAYAAPVSAELCAAGEVKDPDLAAAGAAEDYALDLAAAGAGEVKGPELAAAGAAEVPALELAAADGEVPALKLAAADGEVPTLKLAAADGEVALLELAAADGEAPALELAAAGGDAAEVPALELAAAGGEAAEDEEIMWIAGKRQRVCISEVHPEAATEEPLDAAIARDEVGCSPRAAAWARARLALEDGEVNPVTRPPLRRPVSEAERARLARLVQYTLSGTPAPGSRPSPCSPHPSIWDARGEEMSVTEESKEDEVVGAACDAPEVGECEVVGGAVADGAGEDAKSYTPTVADEADVADVAAVIEGEAVADDAERDAGEERAAERDGAASTSSSSDSSSSSGGSTDSSSGAEASADEAGESDAAKVHASEEAAGEATADDLVEEPDDAGEGEDEDGDCPRASL